MLSYIVVRYVLTSVMSMSFILLSLFLFSKYIASADFPFINIMFNNSFFSDKFVNPDCIKGIILTDKDGKKHCALKEPPGQFYFYSHRRQSFHQPLHILFTYDMTYDSIFLKPDLFFHAIEILSATCTS